MIVTHPCTDMFDKETSRSVHQSSNTTCSPRRATHSSSTSATRRKFASNRRTSRRTARATRTTRTRSSCGYWGEAGRQQTGRVIVVARTTSTSRSSWDGRTARTMNEAIEMAKDTAPPSPDIVLMHMPPIVMAEVTGLTRSVHTRSGYAVALCRSLLWSRRAGRDAHSVRTPMGRLPYSLRREPSSDAGVRPRDARDPRRQRCRGTQYGWSRDELLAFTIRELRSTEEAAAPRRGARRRRVEGGAYGWREGCATSRSRAESSTVDHRDDAPDLRRPRASPHDS